MKCKHQWTNLELIHKHLQKMYWCSKCGTIRIIEEGFKGCPKYYVKTYRYITPTNLTRKVKYELQVRSSKTLA